MKTGTEYHQNEDNEVLAERKYGSMPENLFKLFYLEMWVGEEQSRKQMSGKRENLLIWE